MPTEPGTITIKKMIVTTACASATPYRFQAQEVDTNGNTTGGTHDVYLVMPLGGTENGLYRSPKANEYILACYDGSNYFLMGYLPALPGSDTPKHNFDATMGNLIDDQGEVFRYKKQGERTSVGTHSEIGFYRRRTAWTTNKVETKDPDYDKYKKIAPYLEMGKTDSEVTTAVPGTEQTMLSKFPYVDRVKIQSTGDIYESAENHWQVTGNRVEILAGGASALPPGSFSGGGINVSANGDVTIEAAGKITLKVGRTTVTIDDTGFTVSAAKIKSKVSNNFDSVLSVNARDGISMFGQSVGISALYKASLRDSFSGGVSTTAGVVSLAGRTVKSIALNKAALLYNNIMTGVDWGLSLAIGGRALNLAGKEGDEKANQEVEDGKALYITTNSVKIIKAVADAAWVLAQWFIWMKPVHEKFFESKTTNITWVNTWDDSGVVRVLPSDTAPEGQNWTAVSRETVERNPYTSPDARGISTTLGNTAGEAVGTLATMIGLDSFEIATAFLDMILTITSTVYTTVDTALSKNLKGVALAKMRNRVNYAALAVDNGILEIFTTMMTLFSAGGAGLTPSQVNLRPTGDIVIKASKGKNLYGSEMSKAATPLWMAGMTLKQTMQFLAAAGKLTGAVKPIMALVDTDTKAPAVKKDLGGI